MDSGEENSPAAPAGERTHNLSIANLVLYHCTIPARCWYTTALPHIVQRKWSCADSVTGTWQQGASCSTRWQDPVAVVVLLSFGFVVVQKQLSHSFVVVLVCVCVVVVVVVVCLFFEGKKGVYYLCTSEILSSSDGSLSLRSTTPTMKLPARRKWCWLLTGQRKWTNQPPTGRQVKGERRGIGAGEGGGDWPESGGD